MSKNLSSKSSKHSNALFCVFSGKLWSFFISWTKRHRKLRNFAHLSQQAAPLWQMTKFITENGKLISCCLVLLLKSRLKWHLYITIYNSLPICLQLWRKLSISAFEVKHLRLFKSQIYFKFGNYNICFV